MPNLQEVNDLTVLDQDLWEFSCENFTKCDIPEIHQRIFQRYLIYLAEPPSSAGSGSQQPDSAQQLARQHSSKLAFLPAKSSGGQLHSQEIRPPCRQPSELPNTRKKFESKFPILPELKVPRSSYEGEVEAVDTAEQLNNGAASWTTDEATFVSPSCL